MPLISTLANASARGYGMFGGIASLNSYESIATVTVGAGGSSTVSFGSIPSTYKHLQIRAIAKPSSGAVRWLEVDFNGSNTGWTYHALYGDGGSVTATGGTSLSKSLISLGGSQVGSYVIDILDYANTNKNKTVRALYGYDANGSGYVGLNSGLWINTAAVSTITFDFQSDSIAQYSSFALYGIKG